MKVEIIKIDIDEFTWQTRFGEIDLTPAQGQFFSTAREAQCHARQELNSLSLGFNIPYAWEFMNNQGFIIDPPVRELCCLAMQGGAE